MGWCGSCNRARTHCCAGSRHLDMALREGAVDRGRVGSWFGGRMARVGRKRVSGDRLLPVGRSRKGTPCWASRAHRLGSRSRVRRDHGRDSMETRLRSLGGRARAFDRHPDGRRAPGCRILVRRRSSLHRLNGRVGPTDVSRTGNRRVDESVASGYTRGSRRIAALRRIRSALPFRANAAARATAAFSWADVVVRRLPLTCQPARKGATTGGRRRWTVRWTVLSAT